MEKESVYIRQQEAASILEVSIATVSRVFSRINKEQKELGKVVLKGRCNRAAFYEAIGYNEF